MQLVPLAFPCFTVELRFLSVGRAMTGPVTGRDVYQTQLSVTVGIGILLNTNTLDAIEVDT